VSEPLRRTLRSEPIPGEHEARERAWELARAALQDREAVPVRRARRGRLLVAGAAGLAIVAGAVSPPGLAVLDSVRDAVVGDPVVVRRPALFGLPAPGRLLVNSRQGPWIVQADGSRRLLGPYERASWSPHGRYVVATRGFELFALDPKGKVRWSLARPGSPAQPRWSSDGFRIAYRLGARLRVVAGDGTGDRSLPFGGPGDAAPEWRPGAAHELALVDRGQIVLADTDTQEVLWRATGVPTPYELAWSADGRRLLALSAGSLSVLDARGRRLAQAAGDRGAELAAFAPSGGRLALVRPRAGGGSELVLTDAGLQAAGARRILETAARFSDLEWSPDGRWLLLGVEDADQWLFVRAAAPHRIVTVSNVRRQFHPGAAGPAPFPELAGWCCAP